MRPPRPPRFPCPPPDAQRRQTESLAPVTEFVEEGQQQPGSARPDRMAERDRSPVGIDTVAGRGPVPSPPPGTGPQTPHFTSTTPISSSLSSARARTSRLAGAGPMPMISGGTPTVAPPPGGRPRGCSPLRAAKPLGREHDRPGTVVDPAAVARGHGPVLSESAPAAGASRSAVVSGRICSSSTILSGALRPPGASTGTISSAKPSRPPLRVRRGHGCARRTRPGRRGRSGTAPPGSPRFGPSRGHRPNR